MRQNTLLASLFVLGLQGPLQASPVFEVPKACLSELASTGICVDAWEAKDERGSPDVEAFVIIYKSDFPDLATARDQYFDFGSWQGYYDASGYEKTRVITSVRMDDITKANDAGEMRDFRRNYFHLETKVPIIGRQLVRGVSYYEPTNGDDPSYLSYSFHLGDGEQEVPAGEQAITRGPEGLVKQDGQIVWSECDGYDVCGEDEIMLYYKARLRHRIPLLPQYAAAFTRDQIEALLTGMYLR